MIVDCNTHIWSKADQLGRDAEAFIRRRSGGREVSASPAAHYSSAELVSKTLVMGYVSRYIGAQVPNSLIADYVAANSSRMIGIAGIDPTEAGSLIDAETLLDSPSFRGLATSPAAQNYHPADSRAMALYGLAESRLAPIFIGCSTHFPQSAAIEYARPYLLDEVAREYPQLTIVISGMGHPWMDHCIAMMGKHEHIFGDISSLLRRPWQAYTALVSAWQFGVIDKVLFGSDFPFQTAAEAIERIYRLGELTHGTNLPAVPREALRSVVERNALQALRIARPDEISAPAEPEHVHDEDL